MYECINYPITLYPIPYTLPYTLFSRTLSLPPFSPSRLYSISEADRDAIQTLAVSIFITNAPTDPAKLPDPYVKCLEVGRAYKACVLSGRAIQDSPYHACKTCRHLMLENELIKQTHPMSRGISKKLENCPLCHSPLALPQGVSSSLANALTIM